MCFLASSNVLISSAASSEIEILNSFSSSNAGSTMSNESAPWSSVNFANGIISALSIVGFSMITFSNLSLKFFLINVCFDCYYYL